MAFGILAVVSRLNPPRGAERIDATDKLTLETARQSLLLRAQQACHSMPLIAIAACIVGVAYSRQIPGWRVAGWIIPILLITTFARPLCKKVLSHTDGAASPQV